MIMYDDLNEGDILVVETPLNRAFEIGDEYQFLGRSEDENHVFSFCLKPIAKEIENVKKVCLKEEDLLRCFSHKID